jgi:diguanylate cyclase (GGDEF)-like protein
MPRRKQEAGAKRSTVKKPVPAAGRRKEIVQEHPEDAPPGWLEVQDKLAGSLGLSLLLVDGRQPPAVALSNNNSICHAFQSSPEHVRLCDPYCGDAHRRAMSAGSVVHYKCHAGLECFTMPVDIAGEVNLAAIGGRAFLSGADYRSLVDRFREGELNELLERAPFENVIFSEPQRLTQLSTRLEKAVLGFSAPRSPAPVASQNEPGTEQANELKQPGEPEQQAVVPEKKANAASTVFETQFDLQGEVNRLRGELQHRSDLAESLQHFLERISSKEPEQTYVAILTHAKNLLRAERGSLMVFDENANELVLKAGIGLPIPREEVGRARPGDGVAGQVIDTGRPMVVADAASIGLFANEQRNYKTGSFISYPITMRGRKIGVLNMTDKTSGAAFDDVDLSLLDLVGPQIAIALERAEWQDRATQFQLMSITDPLTGLLNRRYLEERLTEELNRSTRYNYSMSCLMIDIDDFKKYNDLNGHQAGDAALKITAHCLKATLRSADIACRYGGEEFCILLPQTSLSEAGLIAERMRQHVAETDYPYGKSQPLGIVSISVGISTFAGHIDTAEKVISAADRALYNAKSQGKNRIEFFVENVTGAAANK